jgi:hypothetical protein
MTLLMPDSYPAVLEEKLSFSVWPIQIGVNHDSNQFFVFAYIKYHFTGRIAITPTQKGAAPIGYEKAVAEPGAFRDQPDGQQTAPVRRENIHFNEQALLLADKR